MSAPPSTMEADHVRCYRSMMTTSSGIWLGDSPFQFALPVLLYQIVIIFIVSHLIHFVLARLGQPIIISQIVAGMLLSPHCLGRPLMFEKLLFTHQTFEQLGTIAVLVFMLYFFLIGVKVDLTMIPKVGKKAVGIALSSTLLSYAAVHLAASAMDSEMPANFKSNNWPISFAYRWSLTSFVVISSLLRELNLQSSKVGRLALSAALIADVLYMFVVACIGTFKLSNKGGHHLRGLIGLASVLAVVGTILFAMKPLAVWLARRTPEGQLLGQASFVVVLLMAFASGLLCMLIGFDFVAGPLFLGMVLPGGAPLGTTLVERLEHFMVGLLMPMCMAIAGMEMDLSSLVDKTQCGFMVLFLFLSVASKFVGVIVPCLFTRMPHREALSLGLIMITKGIYEVGIAIKWKGKEVADRQTYTIIMISIIVISGSTTPMIRHIYRPEDRFVPYKRRTIQHAVPGDELGILVCIYAQENVNPIIALLKALGPSANFPVCAYLVHLVELVGRAHAVFVPHKRRDKSTSVVSQSDHIANAFYHFESQYPQALSVLPYNCISPFSAMHNDICSLALDKKVSLVVIPFHKHVSDDGSIGFANPAAQTVNANVLQYAPCSVGILVDNGLCEGGAQLHRVGVYFFGGADDREALAIGERMAEHGSVELTLVRFLPPREWRESGRDELIDERMLTRFRQEKANGNAVVYREEVVMDSEGTMGVIRESGSHFDLLIVGRRERKESPLTAGLELWSEYPELGLIGDLLVATDFGSPVSTLVVQQQMRMMRGGSREAIDSPNNTPKAKQTRSRGKQHKTLKGTRVSHQTEGGTDRGRVRHHQDSSAAKGTNEDGGSGGEDGDCEARRAGGGSGGGARGGLVGCECAWGDQGHGKRSVSEIGGKGSAPDGRHFVAFRFDSSRRDERREVGRVRARI
ncbi:cation/H(+) antiporter 15-like [Canna indica]|uniref:Cation/H(+) antiporter 15-like n=1 Tax=Canna indica TaxID=4628 RepID=A0AAQ3JVF9_9LILI|nr:cation/H(+) antiporter 15-like [Canna indica]